MGRFPLHLELADQPVLVVGAGPVGRRRVAALQGAGARVRWVAPDAPPTGGVAVCPRAFEPADVAGARLVFACASAAVNARVAAAGRAAGAWVIRADEAAAGDGIVPALIRRGPLTVGLSTGGGAPAATATLKAALAARIPAAWGAFVAHVTAAREALPPGPARRARMRALASGPLLTALEAGDAAAVARCLETDGGGE